VSVRGHDYGHPHDRDELENDYRKLPSRQIKLMHMQGMLKNMNLGDFSKLSLLGYILLFFQLTEFNFILLLLVKGEIMKFREKYHH
jgi:hypothetical protein